MEYSQLASDEWRIARCENLAAGLNLSRLKMTAAVHYQCSLLCIVIASALAELPVAALDHRDLLPGKSLVDLYRGLDAMASQLRAVCNELLRTCHKSNIAAEFYGSSGTLGIVGRVDANGNLLQIMRQARKLSTSLDQLLKPHTLALDVFKAVANIFPCVVRVQDFLTVTLRAPADLPTEAEACRSSAEELGLIKPPEVFDNIHATFFGGELGGMMLADFNRLARDLDDYRKLLRARIG